MVDDLIGRILASTDDPPREPMPHDWDLQAVPRRMGPAQETFVATAVCARCGAIRSVLCRVGDRSAALDLSGRC